MAWLYLVVAGLFEIGWPLGLKLAQRGGAMASGLALAVGCMAASGCFLYLAQRQIPMGTAYAVWTGIGAAGTFLVGILFFNDPADWLRIGSLLLIITGIVGLKLAHAG